VTLVGCLVLPCDGGSCLQYMVGDSGFDLCASRR